MTLRRFAGLGALLSLISLGIALAQNATLDSGDTACLLTATALVLFMTVPGLALFDGNMDRFKNVLSVRRQYFAITGLVIFFWMAYSRSPVTRFSSFVDIRLAALRLESLILAGILGWAIVRAINSATGCLSIQKPRSVEPVPGSHCERGYSL